MRKFGLGEPEVLEEELLNLRKLVSMQKTELSRAFAHVRAIEDLEHLVETQELEKEQKNVDLRFKNWQIENLQAEVSVLKAQIDSIESETAKRYETTKSWRLTAPLRRLYRAWAWFGNGKA